MINVAPSSSFEAEAVFPSSLGTALTVRIIDNVGGTTLAAQATTERTTGGGSSVYTATLTAPAAGGQYTIVWLDGTNPPATEDLVITGTATAAAAAVGGTFSYAGTVAGSAITTARDKVRLELGDTDPLAVLFYDEELDMWLGARGAGSYLLAAADAADAASRKLARAYDFTTDGQSFKRSQMSKAFKDLARDLRSRAGGITTVDITKIDGYSDDITNQETTGSGTANPRHYYSRVGVADLP